MTRGPAAAATYVALLRGVNVGRGNRIAMADLRAIVAGLGFSDVRTVLNSGNVLFTGSARAADAEAGITRALAQTGLKVRVLVRATAEVRGILAANPFSDATAHPARLLVGLFADGVPPDAVLALAQRDWSPDRLALAGEAAFLACAENILDSSLILAFNKAAGDRTTLRNWATMNKLVAAGA